MNRASSKPALFVLGFTLVMGTTPAGAGGLPEHFSYLSEVAPSIIQDMRYFGQHNFLGRRVAGYEAGECILTTRAAKRLKAVQARLKPKGLSLKVYDCYRPKRAVADFVAWAQDTEDTATKAEFYSTIPKSELFQRRYIAKRSKHSRGSAVDVALVALPAAAEPPFDMGAQAACHLPKDQRYGDNSLDFGTGYDCFHELSHTLNPTIKGKARANRALLVAEMARAGFKNYKREWWHFELSDEVFRKTYFDFPIVARKAAVVAEPMLKVTCADPATGVRVHEGPSIGHEVSAHLPGDARGLKELTCAGEMPLRQWRALDALGRLSVRPPWCQIEWAGADSGKPAVTGWVNGKYLKAEEDENPADCL
ncbi:MAG: M15 family metallopeptidase [Rhizobiales bacterium]|nr:M15 family metallopeptidase [Hyphomicrobiales bacterium]